MQFASLFCVAAVALLLIAVPALGSCSIVTAGGTKYPIGYHQPTAYASAFNVTCSEATCITLTSSGCSIGSTPNPETFPAGTSYYVWATSVGTQQTCTICIGVSNCASNDNFPTAGYPAHGFDGSSC